MHEFSNTRILVTGASGFIGSHMARRLVEEGAQVYVLARENSDLWRIQGILHRVQVMPADIRNREQVAQAVGKVNPDYVFHLAAYGVDSRQRDYFLAAETNVLGILNLVNALKGTDCRKLLNIGSSMEYGDKQEIISEEASLEPFNIYGSTKAAATILGHQLAAENNLSMVTLRAFGVFGENEGSHKFFPHLILSSLRGDDVDLTACQQYRDYLYIENLLDAFLLAAGDLQSRNEIYNVGSGEIQQLKDYVDLVFGLMQAETKPRYGALPYRPDEMWRPQPDIRKIQRRLGWSPRISLRDGLVRTINWYRENLNEYLGTGR